MKLTLEDNIFSERVRDYCDKQINKWKDKYEKYDKYYDKHK